VSTVQAGIIPIDETILEIPATPEVPERSLSPFEVLHPEINKAPAMPDVGGDWDGYRVDHPRVITDTGGYRMWYSG